MGNMHTENPGISDLSDNIFPDLDLLSLKWVDPPGVLQVVGKVPQWLSSFQIDPHYNFSPLQFIQQSHLLKHAFMRAQEFWNRQEDGQWRSGPLQEPKFMGSNVRLEATAFLIGQEKFLHIKKLGLEFDELQYERQQQREALLLKKGEPEKVEFESYDRPDLVGKSSSMQKIYSQIKEIAFGGKTILIEGEPGTGKELVVRAIHSSGPRKKAPFIVSKPEDFLKRGLKAKQSYPTEILQEKWSLHDLVCVKKAKQGTLFVKSFEKILENDDKIFSRGILPVKKSKRSESVIETSDVLQWVLAVNCPLKELVTKNFLDLDILCQTSINWIQIPALRERKEDIPLLCTQFLAQRRVMTGKWRIQEIEEIALDRLCAYKWPGNVDELKQALYHAFDQCRGEKIQVDDLPSTVI